MAEKRLAGISVQPRAFIPISHNQKDKPYFKKHITPMQLLHSSIAKIIIVQVQKMITFVVIRDSNRSPLSKGN